MFVYRSSKAALNNAWSTGLAKALQGDGIVCLPRWHPGWVKTDMGGQGAPLTPDKAMSSLRAHIDRWTLADSGRYLSWDGKELPW